MPYNFEYEIFGHIHVLEVNRKSKYCNMKI